MADDLTLWPELEPLPLEQVAEEVLSRDRRRTLQQKATIARGRHPLTGGMAFPGASCGTCPALVREEGRYLKCSKGPRSRSAETDVRRWWPACLRHPAAQAGLESKP